MCVDNKCVRVICVTMLLLTNLSQPAPNKQHALHNSFNSIIFKKETFFFKK